MKEICIDARMATCSGVGTYIRSLLPRFLKAPYRWRLLIDADSLQKCPELAAFDVILMKSPIYSLQEQLLLPFSIPRCDLFWSPHFNIPLAPIRARKRLVTIHDVYFLAHARELSLPKRIYSRHVIKAAVQRSDRVVTDSYFSQEEIIKYIGPVGDKITVIPLGSEKNKSEGHPEDPLTRKYILYVGLFAPRKNLCNLLRALDFLPQDVHLVLAGKESEWDGWKKEVKIREERVTVLGQVSDARLIQLYQDATLLVQPSFYEGFGLTPLEAMGFDCPVVVSETGSLPEVCGDAAVYVDPRNPESIARGILSVWSNQSLQGELREKGRKRTAKFNWDDAAKKHLEEIEKLL